MRIAAIVVNYETPGLVTDCLASLRPELAAGDEVVVVDNGSTDGSPARLAGTLDEQGWGAAARLLSLPRNGGFAYGVNAALRAAPAADAYLLLNSDTVVRPGALAALAAALAADPEAGIVGARLEKEDGAPQASAFRFPSPLGETARAAGGVVARILGRWAVAGADGRGVAPPGWVSFAAVLIGSAVVARIGGLDEGYFLFYEDVDYCRRARAAGFGVASRPDARVVHRRAGGPFAAPTARAAARRAHLYASRARYYARFHGRSGLWTANLCWTAGRMVSLAGKLVSGRGPRLHPGEARAIWTNALRPLSPPGSR